MLSPNTLLQNRYLITRELARGGQGAVYEATDLTGGVAVAVKESLVGAAQVQLRKAFEREARLLQGLRHPALPRMIDYFGQEDGQFLVMEFIAGKDLSGLLEGRLQNNLGPFPPEQALAWADQLLDVLVYLHEHQPPIIHRDIKPHNLKPAPGGQLMLLDFGLAKGAVTHMSHLGYSIRGYTPHYAALEQMQGEGTDARSDLYSVAATLHHLLTGEKPPTALARVTETIRGKPDSLKAVTALNPLVPVEVAAVIYSALSQNPDARPATTAEMRQALRDWKPTPTPPPRSQPMTPQLRTFEFQIVTLDAWGQIIDRRKAQGRYFSENLGGSVTLDMVEIPSGTFMMGAPETEKERTHNEGPQHRVTVPPFFIGKFQVTQAQWRAVTKLPKMKLDLQRDPAHFKGAHLPVEQVSWEEAREFCARLSRKTGSDYRLPSEAEWEYACRAGTTTPFTFGETITSQIVNYHGNYPYAGAPKEEHRKNTVPAGSLDMANAFGLFDMHGNVWEWCEDVWHDNYDGAPDDGSAWLSGGDSNYRRLRGGSWGVSSVYCRSAYRYGDSPDARSLSLGFRVVVGARIL